MLTTDRNDPNLRKVKENGQNEAYLILSDEERAKGFVRPFKDSYIHVGKLIEGKRVGGCGALTKMNKIISETYAREPKFYSATFCIGCGKHLPVNEFLWDNTNEEVGS